MKFNPINIIHVLIIWQSLLIAIVLATPKYNKNKSNKFLSLLLLTLGVHFIYNLLYTNSLFLHILPPYSCCYGFLYGPLFFLYIKFNLEKDATFRPFYWFHFSPFFSIILLTFLGFYICRYVSILIFPVMLVYAAFSFREISVYTKTISHVYSKNFNSETKWLKTLSVFMLVIVVFDLLQSRLPFFFLFNIKISMEVVVQVGLFLFVSMINYQGLKKSHTFQQISESDIEMGKLAENKTTFSAFDKNILRDFSIKLEEHMMKDQPFLNPDLNINILAGELEVSEKTISQTINHVIGTNFSDYINSYRIEFARLKLEKDINNTLSMKEIMFDVGFSSRSVFNTAFKKKIGLTPSEYKKKLQY